MFLHSPFSYKCNACGRCCYNQVITLSPYDVIRLARAAHTSTTETIARFTLRRGSLLRFESEGRCTLLNGFRCTVHSGRPFACRLYPLGIEAGRLAAREFDSDAKVGGSQPLLLEAQRADSLARRACGSASASAPAPTDPIPRASTSERYPRFEGGRANASFVRLEPAAGSAGVYGIDSTVADFLKSQHIAPYFDAVERYRSLIPLMRARIDALIDFDRIESREFWRRAFQESMRETNYDPNPLITLIFDADAAIRPWHYHSEDDLIDAHLSAIAELIRSADDPALIAVAAFLLAVSLGYGSTEVTAG